MEQLNLPIEEIHQSSDLMFKLSSEDKLSAVKLSISISKWGQLKPLLVIQRDGKFLLVEGSQLLMAMRMAGFHKAWCINLGPITDKEAAELACALNFNQREIDYIQLAKKIKSEQVLPKDLASFTSLPLCDWESLERILDFNWDCFLSKKENSNQLDLFGGEV